MQYIFILALLATATAYSQATQELEVRGYGRLKSQPDQGVLSASVRTIQKDFGSTVSVLTSDTDKLIEHLEKAGFKRQDIKTTAFEVEVNTIYAHPRSYDSGFVGRQRLRIEFENTKNNIAKIVDAFTRSPVNAQFGFRFTVSDNLRDRLQTGLIKIAINDARQKAKLISESASQQLVRIRKIKYGTFSVDNFGTYCGASLDMEIPEPHQVSPSYIGFETEELTFSDYVIIIYEIK
jgi:uncharacterized protein YggE